MYVGSVDPCDIHNFPVALSRAGRDVTSQDCKTRDD